MAAMRKSWSAVLETWHLHTARARVEFTRMRSFAIAVIWQDGRVVGAACAYGADAPTADRRRLVARAFRDAAGAR